MKKKAILPSCYLPPVEYLSVIRRYETVIIDKYEHYIKQTYRNRCVIASSLGRQALTVPVEKNIDSNVMADMRISDHGNWRHLHVSAMDSSYMNSPYYEYYRDDILPFYKEKYEFLVEYNTALLKLICNLMDIPFNIEFSSSYVSNDIDSDDYRPFMSSKLQNNKMPLNFGFKEYYQVFSSRYGFLDNLSCVDLLFNMGPESILYL